jgi:transglutaminase-like putative cysteine protease
MSVIRMNDTVSDKEMQVYLNPTRFIDSLSPAIIGFSRNVARGASDDVEKATRLYYAVRDRVRYSPYRISLNPDDYLASRVLAEKTGFCIQKAILLTAVSRSVGLPCRLGFADVRNHLTTRRLKELMRTDRFLFHGYLELSRPHRHLTEVCVSDSA